MNVKLYQCTAVESKMNKSSFLQNELDIECYCRNPIDKTNPVFVFEIDSINRNIIVNDNDVITSDNNDVVNIINTIDANYLYCVEWERYYFIDSIIYNNNKLFTISCSLDDLMTFKDSNSLNVPLYISRRTKGNKFIADNLEQFTFDKLVSINDDVVFHEPNTAQGYSSFGLTFGNYTLYENFYCVVIAVSNPAFIETRVPNIPVPDRRQNEGTSTRLKSASPNSSMTHTHTLYYVITPRMLIHLCGHALTYSNIMGSILSITILPYEIATTASDLGSIIDFFPSQPIDFTSFGFSATSVKYAKFGNNDRFLFKTIDIPNATSYKDFEPYTTAQIYIPFAETITLDLQKVRGSTLRLYYYVDFNTSTSFYELYNMTLDCVVHSGVCQLGYKFNLTTSNAEELRNISENNVLSFLFGNISSSLSLMTNNPNAIIGTGRGAINSLSQFITRENSMIGKTQATATASNTGAFMPIDVYIEFSHNKSTISDLSIYYQNMGMPYNEFEYISNIDDNEFVIVGDTSDIAMSSGMSKTELDLLKNSLAKGFYK